MASGIPKRASNKQVQATRKTSWSAGQSRKQARVAVQRDAEIRNQGLRRAGMLTPWEMACQDRAAVRLAAGCRARWEAAQRKKTQLPAAVL